MTTPPCLETVLIESLSHTAVLLSYNQPHISNAFTLQQYRDTNTALVWTLAEPDVTVVVITGKGKHYCAGKAMIPPEHGQTIDDELEAGATLGETLRSFPKVLIAAVNGASIGWGCTQLYLCDLVYAWEKAFFQTPFTSIGIVPEGGSSYTFPKVMGKQHASALLLAADKLSAQEMYVSGLVTNVIAAPSQAEFLEVVIKQAKKIGAFNAESLRMTKALIHQPGVAAELRATSLREGHDLRIRFASDDVKETMKAFSDKSSKSKL